MGYMLIALGQKAQGQRGYWTVGPTLVEALKEIG